jgi:long-chain acyl-CoA synthetase
MTTTLATTPTGHSLQRLAEASWERHGDASVLVFEGARWTGTQLADRSRRVGQGLRDLGLRPGERVVVCMANCSEVGVVYHAVWRAGGVTTPVLFLLSESELRHVLEDSEAAYIVTTPEFLPKVQAAAAGVTTLRGVVLAGEPTEGTIPFAQLEAAPVGELLDSDPSDLAALLYTGGTTGRSKGVMLSHDAMSSAAWAGVAMTFDPAQTISLLPLPLSHAMGCWCRPWPCTPRRPPPRS